MKGLRLSSGDYLSLRQLSLSLTTKEVPRNKGGAVSSLSLSLPFSFSPSLRALRVLCLLNLQQSRLSVPKLCSSYHFPFKAQSAYSLPLQRDRPPTVRPILPTKRTPQLSNLVSLGNSLNPSITETVLKELRQWKSAHEFFLWAESQPRYRHNEIARQLFDEFSQPKEHRNSANLLSLGNSLNPSITDLWRIQQSNLWRINSIYGEFHNPIYGQN